MGKTAVPFLCGPNEGNPGVVELINSSIKRYAGKKQLLFLDVDGVVFADIFKKMISDALNGKLDKVLKTEYARIPYMKRLGMSLLIDSSMIDSSLSRSLAAFGLKRPICPLVDNAIVPYVNSLKKRDDVFQFFWTAGLYGSIGPVNYGKLRVKNLEKNGLDFSDSISRLIKRSSKKGMDCDSGKKWKSILMDYQKDPHCKFDYYNGAIFARRESMEYNGELKYVGNKGGALVQFLGALQEAGLINFDDVHVIVVDDDKGYLEQTISALTEAADEETVRIENCTLIQYVENTIKRLEIEFQPEKKESFFMDAKLAVDWANGKLSQYASKKCERSKKK